MDRHTSLISIWLQLELCAMAVLLIKGEIRCYCDAPHCVATGYMCKSPLNACFTRVLDPRNVNSPLGHGCVDSLAPLDVCAPRGVEGAPGGSGAARCCHDDMCNYRGLRDLEPPKEHGGRHEQDGGTRSLITKVQELASAREVWFRAAVIAVPVAGGLILALLVMLALRMLRSESRSLRLQRQQTLARLQHGFRGHRHSNEKGLHPAKLDVGYGSPVAGLQSDGACPACDKMYTPVLGGQGILSLVHWETYRGPQKQEFV
ncbi:BMP and activin membrane-bound inhibitor homolog isoform X2 [Paramormyrops kingsleyae]|uniref:BMP and activin membrane-bound inhibitor homolog n=1 Tax=Paramormyrops kingsleyae TaxID=1676925 RepID=A0A3B3SFY6_9TELE|nr:BMP and activin membrane-bound inhibitor homolog isoform X2 [Paramormyrops kingsleyae]